MRRLVAAAAAFAAAIGCSSSSPTAAPTPDAATPDTGTRPADAGADVTAPSDAGSDAPGSNVDAAGIIAARPYTLHVPANLPAGPAPLVVLFHGYGFSGQQQELYMNLTAASDKHGFLYAYGDGTIDSAGKPFWNATDACCDLNHVGVDDVSYFDAIVADVASKQSVDRKRVFVVGHSNGGFMSHRLACDRAGTVAAILSLAGAVYNDATKCAPSQKVSVVELHGDADPTISYTGGMTTEGTYPSTTQTVATWASKNGCTGALADTGQTLDIDSSLAGSETKVESYGGCPTGIDVQRWTIQGGSHIPGLTQPGWSDALWAFLSTHAKP